MVTQMTLITPVPQLNPLSAIIVSSPCSVIHIPGHLFRDVILFECHLCCNIVIRCHIKFWSLAHSAWFVFHAEWFVHVWMKVRVLLFDVKCSLGLCFDIDETWAWVGQSVL
jgi:hypothetical protein